MHDDATCTLAVDDAKKGKKMVETEEIIPAQSTRREGVVEDVDEDAEENLVENYEFKRREPEDAFQGVDKSLCDLSESEDKEEKKDEKKHDVDMTEGDVEDLVASIAQSYDKPNPQDPKPDSTPKPSE